MIAGRAPVVVVGARRAAVAWHSQTRVPGAAGQGIVEFGVILAVAAAVAILVLVFFRPQLAFVLSLIGSEVEKSSWLLALRTFV